jgi:hypothetical protein
LFLLVRPSLLDYDPRVLPLIGESQEGHAR